MLNLDVLDDDVLSDIANNMDLDTGKDEDVKKIARLSFEEAWEKYCVWNGLLGNFHIALREAYENLKVASIEEENA